MVSADPRRRVDSSHLPLVVAVTGSRHWAGWRHKRGANAVRRGERLTPEQQEQSNVLRALLRKTWATHGSTKTKAGDLVPRSVKPILIHGDCEGADWCARFHASGFGWRIHDEPAPWDAGFAAGPLRNELMIDLVLQYRKHAYPCVLIACPFPDSRGTWNCVNYAKAQGFEEKGGVILIERSFLGEK